MRLDEEVALESSLREVEVNRSDFGKGRGEEGGVRRDGEDGCVEVTNDGGEGEVVGRGRGGREKGDVGKDRSDRSEEGEVGRDREVSDDGTDGVGDVGRGGKEVLRKRWGMKGTSDQREVPDASFCCSLPRIPSSTRKYSPQRLLLQHQLGSSNLRSSPS